MRPRPICLYISAASLLITLVVFGGMYLIDTHSRGAGEGYSAGFGQGLVVIGCFVLIYIAGAISSIVGLFRGEQPKAILFLLLIAFLAPYIALFIYNGLHPIGATR